MVDEIPKEFKHLDYVSDAEKKKGLMTANAAGVRFVCCVLCSGERKISLKFLD